MLSLGVALDYVCTNDMESTYLLFGFIGFISFTFDLISLRIVVGFGEDDVLHCISFPTLKTRSNSLQQGL